MSAYIVSVLDHWTCIFLIR